MRLVIDASVLLAAPAGRPDGPPSLLIEAARQGTIEMIARETLPGELESGLEGEYDYLVALARAAGADAIITGDRDLLDHEGLDPPALTPRQACELLGLLDDLSSWIADGRIETALRWSTRP